MKYEDKHVPTGVRGLDRLLGGGVEAGAITEFVGEYGTGKTQLCHQLAVMARVERLGRVLYLDAEGTFRPERIVSISEARGLDPEEALENIDLVKVKDWPQLILFVNNIPKYCLIILDSITPLFAVARSLGEARRQRGRMALLVSSMLEHAFPGKVSVIITNVEYRGRVFAHNYLLPFIKRIIRLAKTEEEIKAEVVPPREEVKLYITESGVEEL